MKWVFAIALAITACLFSPVAAQATPVGERCPWTEDPADIPKVLTYTCNRTFTPSTLPSVGDTWDLGYATVTDAYFSGSSSYSDPNHQAWFSFTITNNTYLGGTVNFQYAAQCIDPRAQTPGCVTSGTEGWPATWTGRYVSQRITFTVEAVVVGTDGTVMIRGTLNGRSEDPNGAQHGSIQRIRTTSPIRLVFPYEAPASLSLTKASSKPAVTNGNSLYSFQGIQYTLFATQQDAAAGTNGIFTWTFDANGNTTDKYETMVGAPVTYYVKETSLGSSKGYELDPQVHAVTIEQGTNTFAATDIPMLDPFPVYKRDIETGATPQGGATLAGAQFRVEHYSGLYATVAAAQASGSPDYVWIIQTRADGSATLADRVSGDPVIYTEAGDAVAPLGTILVQEIQAPTGYLLNDPSPIQIAQITESGIVYISSEGMAFTNEVKHGYIEVHKTLINSAGETVSPARLAGIQVKVISKTTGAVVTTLTLDANGYAKSGELVYDTYKLVEDVSTVPVEIEPWHVTNGVSADTPFATVDVHEDGATVSASFSDILKTGSAELLKKSSDEQIAASSSIYRDMTGATYGLYESEADAQADTNRIFTFTCAADGTTNKTGQIECGTHLWVRELTAPTSGAYKMSDQIVEVVIRDYVNVFTVTEEPYTGSFIVKKLDSETGETPQGEATLAGAEVTVQYWPIYAATVDSCAGTPEDTFTLTTGADGTISSGTVPLGSYIVTETKAPEGYKLSDTGKHLVIVTSSGTSYVGSSDAVRITDEVIKGRIKVTKTLIGPDGNPTDVTRVDGLKIIVKDSSGATVETLTLAGGTATTGLLPYGTYTLEEDAASLAAIDPHVAVCDPNPFATVDIAEAKTYSVSFEDEVMHGSIDLYKQSTDEQVSGSSSIYDDMSGATYGLYESEADAQADTNRIFTFETDENGKTQTTSELEIGTYWVREITAPTSGAWELNDQVVEVEIAEGENHFAMEEKPFSGTFEVLKRDAETGATSQGEATLEGAVFHIDYYPVVVSSIGALDGLTPEKSFDLTTDASGKLALDEKLAMGSWVIAETEAPYGYLLSDDEKHLIAIDGSGVHGVIDGALTVYDEAVKATITVEKTLRDAGGSIADTSKLAGIQIAIADATGAVVETLTLDATGHAASSELPVGTYTLTEVAASVPAGIQPWAWTASGSSDEIAFDTIAITPADDGTVFESELTDYTTTTITVKKTDVDTGEGLAGATITLYKAPDAYITIEDGAVTVSGDFDRTDLANWEKIGDYKSDAAGFAGASMLPFGLYAWAELAPFITPDGDVYLDEARTADIDATAPIIHEILIDATHRSTAQSCADKKVDIAVKITERTIAITSAALVTEDYQVDNTGTEGQWYFISAANVSSVDTDDFYIEYDFDDIRSHGGRVITVCTPTTTGDKDGSAILYYKTDGSDWIAWAEVSATAPARFNVADLGGVELAGIKIDYGRVTKDMTVGTSYAPANSDDLAFEIVYTIGITPEDKVVIRHDSRVYTDLAVSSETTIWADDVAAVETTVIFPKDRKSGFEPNGGSGIIGTGDMGVGLLAGIIGLGLLSVAYLVAKRRRKVAARMALAAITVGLSLALLPMLAFAEPAIIEKTYTYMEGEAQPAIPETVTEKGDTYNLVSVSEPVVDSTFKPATQTFTRSGSGNFGSLAEAHEAYPDTIAIDEDGFVGEIPQTSFDVKEIYGTYTKVEDVTRTFGPFPTNDVTWIIDLVDMEYSAPVWEVIETNSVGIPTSYMVTVITKEATSMTVQTGYSVTATYQGEISRDETRYVITATYEGPDGDAVAPEPEPEPTPATPSEPESKGLSAGAIAGIAGGGVAFLGLLFGVLFFRRKNVIVRDLADTADLGKATLKVKDGKATVTIPASIPVEEGVLLKLKDEHATGGELSVVHEGRGEVLSTRSARKVYVQPAKGRL